MIAARTQHKSLMAMVQYQLFPELSGDCRLLVPGWAGELNPTELEFVLDQLNRDRQLDPPLGVQIIGETSLGTGRSRTGAGRSP